MSKLARRHHRRGQVRRARLLRRAHAAAAPRPRRDGARHRRRHLDPDRDPLRAARGIQPRLTVGRGRGPGSERARRSRRRTPINRPPKLHGGVEPGTASTTRSSSTRRPRCARSTRCSARADGEARGGAVHEPAAARSRRHRALPGRPGDEEDARDAGREAGDRCSARPRHALPLDRTSTARRGSRSSPARSTRSIWLIRNLGFTADPVPTTARRLNSRPPPDPLATTTSCSDRRAGPPAEQRRRARARLTAFFAAGGGYIGAGVNGAGFLTSAGLVTGLTAARASGERPQRHRLVGQHGRRQQPDHGRVPGPRHGDHGPADLAHRRPGPLADRRAPAALRVLRGRPVAARRAVGDRSGGAGDRPRPNAAGTTRLAVFAMNPLYRADPEREWPAFASAASGSTSQQLEARWGALRSAPPMLRG